MCWDCQAISQIGCWAFESLPCHFPFMRTFFFKPFESVAALWSVKRAREVGCEYKEACNRRSKWGGTGLEAGATGGGTEVVAAAVTAPPGQTDRKAPVAGQANSLQPSLPHAANLLKDSHLTTSHLKAIFQQSQSSVHVMSQTKDLTI